MTGSAGQTLVANEVTALALDDGTVDVWVVRLDTEAKGSAHLAALLSQDEGARAERFVFPHDKRRFVAAHVALRQILGSYAGQSPASLRFTYGPSGKPALTNQPEITFNLSHSGELALIATSVARELGIDVEYCRPLDDLMLLAEGCFSAQENAVLRALPEDQRMAGFFNCWTRKEAFIKALGAGLSYPLDRFDVSLKPGEPAKLLRVEGDTFALGEWTLVSFEPAQHYTAAMAIRGQISSIRLREWAFVY